MGGLGKVGLAATMRLVRRYATDLCGGDMSRVEIDEVNGTLVIIVWPLEKKAEPEATTPPQTAGRPSPPRLADAQQKVVTPAAPRPPAATGGGDDALTVLERGQQLVEKFRNGIPAEIVPVWSPDIVHDQEVGEAAFRNPTKVEIDITDKNRTYAALRFWRGDVRAVVGFRGQPPYVMGVYVGGDAVRVGRMGGTGGGGARAAAVKIPRTPQTLLKALNSLGAEVREHANGTTADVIFKGRTLDGKLNLKHAEGQRATIQKEFERWRRKLEHAASATP